MQQTRRRVMALHDVLSWVPGWTVSRQDKTVTIVTDEGENVTLPEAKVIEISEKSLEAIEDLCKMEELHESLIMENLKKRYKEDTIYTYIGPMVVSINPFKIIEKYGEQVIPDYRSKDKDQLPAHIYSTAQQAHQFVVLNKESQSIIISGESGAGKTEATKIVLKFLTVASGEESQADDYGKNLAEKILATNPILEAFGNAKTVRNNNSSRFGKFIKISFEGTKIIGAQIDNYLLEKSRIVFQAPTERCYHIFYQLLVGSSEEQKKKFHLLTPNDYLYLNNGMVSINGVDEKEDFAETCRSMSALGFPPQDVDYIFSILSGILLIGNLEFVGEDKVEFGNIDVFNTLREVWSVSEVPLKESLLGRYFVGGMNKNEAPVFIPFNQAQAVENRDALAKQVYANLFDWLVKRLNTQLGQPPANKPFIGVLDIYGFEIFQNNSLEQFMINYANEKLHNQFNEHMFKSEQAEYVKEGVSWEEIEFRDNSICVDLIEKTGRGILAMLDEECKVPKGTDQGFLERTDNTHKRNPCFQKNPKAQDSFTITHFAGEVAYNSKGFLEKTKDTMSLDVIKALKTTKNKIIIESWNKEGGPIQPDQSEGILRAESSKRGSLTRQKTVTETSKMTLTAMFKQDLHNLVEILSSSRRHYIRCIKPNDTKEPLVLEPKKLLSQLACNGVLETVKLRKQGYSHRLPFERFIDRFFVCLAPHSRHQDGIKELLTTLPGSDKKTWAMGHTKVFLKDTAVKVLQEKQRDLWKNHAVTLQKGVRAHFARQKHQKLFEERRATILLQSYVRQRKSRNVYDSLIEEFKEKKRKITFVQSQIRKFNANTEFGKLKEQNGAATTLQKFIRSSAVQVQFQEDMLRYQKSLVLVSYFRRMQAILKLLDLKWFQDEKNRYAEKMRLEELARQEQLRIEDERRKAKEKEMEEEMARKLAEIQRLKEIEEAKLAEEKEQKRLKKEEKQRKEEERRAKEQEEEEERKRKKKLQEEQEEQARLEKKQREEAEEARLKEERKKREEEEEKSRLEKKQREEAEETRLKEERRKREEEEERRRIDEENERRRKREQDEDEERIRKKKLLELEEEEERRKKKKREEEEEEERRRRKKREEEEEEEKARKEKKKQEEKEKKRKKEEQRKQEEQEEEERRKRERKRREEEEEEAEQRRRERRRKELEEEEEQERKRMEAKRKELEALNSLRRESTLGLARKQQMQQQQQSQGTPQLQSSGNAEFDEGFEIDEMTPQFGLEAFEDKMFQTAGRQSRRGGTVGAGGSVDFAALLGNDDVNALERELDFDLEDASQWNDANQDQGGGTFSPRDSFASNAPNRMSRRSMTTNAGNSGTAPNSPMKRSNTQRQVLQQPPPKQSVMQTQIPQQEFERLLQFLQPVGVEYASVFAREAVDLEVMLQWENPETELKEMGITQRGVLFKLVKLIKDLQKEMKPMDMYERDKITQLEKKIVGLENELLALVKEKITLNEVCDDLKTRYEKKEEEIAALKLATKKAESSGGSSRERALVRSNTNTATITKSSSSTSGDNGTPSRTSSAKRTEKSERAPVERELTASSFFSFGRSTPPEKPKESDLGQKLQKENKRLQEENERLKDTIIDMKNNIVQMQENFLEFMANNTK